MVAADTSVLKERIISAIRRRGPSLPVHIAKETGLSILYASAFLSELFAEKKIVISTLKIGSSPLYLLEEQIPLLEKFSNYLKSKEKDAFILLKEKQVIKDSDQEPAIRVALRAIKDFAIPLKKGEEIYWRYFLASEKQAESAKEKTEIKKEIIKEKIPERKIEKEKEESDEKEHPEEKKKIAEKKIVAKKQTKTGKKQDDEFLEKVKEFLSKSSVTITNIESLGRGEIILRIKVHGKEQLLVGYNKKKIGEKEIINASKKAKELEMKYSIISISGLPKKISELIEALENIEDIEKIE